MIRCGSAMATRNGASSAQRLRLSAMFISGPSAMMATGPPS
jgi:hypothetical protein